VRETPVSGAADDLRPYWDQIGTTIVGRDFGSVHARHRSADPDVVIPGNRVLHLRYRVRR